MITVRPPGAQLLQYAQGIEAQEFVLPWPGDGDTNDEPGHRDVPSETHLFGPSDTDPLGSTQTVFYNFRQVIGQNVDEFGVPFPFINLITEIQKERAREIFDLYSRYSGIQFVETAEIGIIVATGHLEALGGLSNPGGVIGLAGNNQYGQPMALLDKR